MVLTFTPYKCKGCKDKREYIVRNGKAKERIIKAGKVGTQRISDT